MGKTASEGLLRTLTAGSKSFGIRDYDGGEIFLEVL
jgi:hypothetical protein